MIASPEIHEFIKRFEGYRSKSYRCSANVLTIGWGHTRDVKENQICTKEQAAKWFMEDIRLPESQLIKALNADEIAVTQRQFDALVSFVFNCGIYTLLHGARKAPVTSVGSIWKHLKSGDIQRAADSFMLYNNGGLPGLVKRRKAERDIFLGADPNLYNP